MRRILIIAALASTLPIAALAQTTFPSQRTITKTDRFDFGSGGTVAIAGAPIGSIEIIGSTANEVEITAEILLQAGSEADLNTLAASTGFLADESALRAGIITVGNHNKFGLKKLPKNFPNGLLTVPFTINYILRVPRYCDLEIDGGKGDLTIKGVEGSIRANLLESNARVEIIGGAALISLGTGNADISFGAQGWRGRSASIQVAQGDLTVRLPTILSAEVDAVVLRTGSIENKYPDLKPRDRKTAFTEKLILAKTGVGGAAMKFSVGDGKLRIEPLRAQL
ncbi:hypothetical protein BH20ACI2_BH20ACI2_10810 [soil metagenome]